MQICLRELEFTKSYPIKPEILFRISSIGPLVKGEDSVDSLQAIYISTQVVVGQEAGYGTWARLLVVMVYGKQEEILTQPTLSPPLRMDQCMKYGTEFQV